MKGYDNWRLQTPWDDEPNHIHCIKCGVYIEISDSTDEGCYLCEDITYEK